MRGKAHWLRAGLLERRITPAYAGKSMRQRLPRSFCRDHPRLCGEKLCVRIFRVCVQGSPPPMRGKVLSFAVEKTTFQDHPRLCGEKRRGGQLPDLRVGSPPPMRGKAAGGSDLMAVSRITPAYAGKRHSEERKQR